MAAEPRGVPDTKPVNSVSVLVQNLTVFGKRALAGAHLQHVKHVVVPLVAPAGFLHRVFPQLDRCRELLERLVALRGGDLLRAPHLQKSTGDHLCGPPIFATSRGTRRAESLTSHLNDLR